ncbi:GAF and ANTAR domain-containing protein [Nocardia brasiliensis]|uniref:GAF and ANTAR domain-containing protein n=1 Tax=Nocardia brasiliensis TaxID=37326 RepID=UPI002456CA78|nr:GAF and ANTAR domain-containing protein [Nocardia brasiliensis]
MFSDSASTEEPSNEATAAQIAAAFARMSGLFLSAGTVDTALRMVTTLAVEIIPHVAGAGITLLDRAGKQVTTAATDPVVERADSAQYSVGAGPCLTAWSDRVLVRIDDLATDERWPVWSRAAAELGLRASLSTPLVAGSHALGAIKVYAVQPDTFGVREENLLTMFSAQAAMLLANVRAAEDAERVSAHIADGLRAREVVTLAKGIVMARDGVDERTAFLTLAHTARRQNSTVRQVAERLAGSTVTRRR